MLTKTEIRPQFVEKTEGKSKLIKNNFESTKGVMWRSIHRRFWLSPVPNNEKLQDPKFSFLFLATKREIVFSGITQLKNQVFPVNQSEQIKHSSPQRKYVRKKIKLERQFRQIASLLIIYLAEKQEKEKKGKLIFFFLKKVFGSIWLLFSERTEKRKRKIPKILPLLCI